MECTSSTHVERTALKKTPYFIQTILYIFIVNHLFIYNFEVMGMRCGQYLLLAP